MNDQFTKPNLGKIVRVERERRSLTQERLAEYIRVGVRSIQRLEATGRTSPHTFSQVAKAFQLTPEQLAQRAEEFDLDKSLDQLGKIVRLEERLTGYGLIDALKPAHSLNHETEMSIRESVPREALELCDKLEMLEIWDDLKPSNQHDFAQELTRDIECLHSLGIACLDSLRFWYGRWPTPNPPRIRLIREAEVRGCIVLDGLGMLVSQRGTA
jgi:transcriptional regulator with XRE-family HTH domain